ncbi:MAG: coproporphyrinogen dehydrogenase [Sphingomonadales bacterium]|nr:coproporphyrinogen dehydrogenase [Sphingomonadales bacterium]
MWTYYPELLERPVPRYTSFPTAAEFGPLGAEPVEAALATTEGEVSLYVHIPFCQEICWYCGCNTGAANKRSRLESYLETLHQEIALVARKLGRKAHVTRVAFGGGSPNAITPTDFVRIVAALTASFRLEDSVWSIELDPRTLPDVWGPVLRHVGVTRASMGVQTFAPHLQEAIGRVQPDDMIVRGTRLLRDAGVGSINFDLMYGLPGQTIDDLAHSLARTVELGADRIALFGYAHVPDMLPRQRRIDATALPSQATRFAMAAMGHDFLVGHGYVPVGFDHFALPGDAIARATLNGTLRRNFQGFTEDQAPVLIGIGASSISCFPGVLAQNDKNAGRYRMLLSQDRLPIAHGIERTAADAETGAIINALLCQGEARLDAAHARAIAPALQPFLDRGLATLADDRLRILPGGLPYARTIAALFDPYRQVSQRKFSSAV